MGERYFDLIGDVHVDNPAGKVVGAFFTDSIIRYIGDVEDLLEMDIIQDVLAHNNIPIKTNLDSLYDFIDVLHDQVEAAFLLGSVDVDELERAFVHIMSIRQPLGEQIVEIRNLAHKKIDDEEQAQIVDNWVETTRLLLIALDLYGPDLNRAIVDGHRNFVEEHGETL